MMKRIILLSLLIACFFVKLFSQTTDLVVDCQTPGWLSSMINYGDQQTVRNLKVTGYVNATDLKFIGTLISNQNLDGKLDLSNCNIVQDISGGENDYLGNYLVPSSPKNLRVLIIPKSVTKVEGCTGEYLLVDSLYFDCKMNEVSCSCFGGTSTNIFYLHIGENVEKIPGQSLINFREGIGFCGVTNIKNVHLPNSLTKIEDCAFMNSGISNVNIKDLQKLEYIGSFAFVRYHSLWGLSGAYCPDTLFINAKSFNSSAFPYKDGQHIFIGENVTEIGSGADLKHTFSFGSNLIFHMKSKTPPTGTSPNNTCTVYVPKGAKEAYLNSNWNNATIIEASSLTLNITSSGNGSVLYENTIIKNQTKAFSIEEGSSAIIEFSPDNGYRIASVKLNGTDLTSSITNNQYTINNISSDNTLEVKFEAEPQTISFEDAAVEQICVANWDKNGSGTLSEEEAAVVTDIGTVFSGNTSIISFDELKYFTGLQTISSTAFKGCNKLEKISFPSSITSIGDEAFSGCIKLSGSIIIPNTVSSIGMSVFYQCRGLNGTLTLPNSITSIGDAAFYGCSGLTGSLIIPNSVTYIGEGAFIYCHGFTGSLTIPNSVVTIRNDAFRECSGFTGPLTIPNSVETIGRYAFYQCTGLTDVVTLSNSINTIEEYAFAGLNNIKKVVSLIESPFTISTTVFSGISSDAVLQVPNGTKSKYQEKEGWRYNFKEIIEETTNYTLTIKSTGNGIAEYNETAIRGKSSSFTVNEGTSATVKFTPDAGYKIKSVKLNTTDITASVANNQYTINNIKGDNTLEVEFEAITHTLTIKATGNGSATFNSTAVKGKSQVFTVNEGTSATVTFTPDAGYRIKSVKLNSIDVTANVISNQYTISNIKSDNTLEVEFEAITHTLTIKAIGNGSATFNSIVVKGKSQSFTVNEGTSAIITFTPDAGYRIKSVKLNTTDVTASVANNQYTISNIKSDNTLEVEFEAITHTLTIKAIGNGSATFNSTAVKGRSQAFTVNEGASATVTFTPDAGYRIKSVKLNTTDVTASVANNQYTISNIKSDNTLEVEFEAITHTLTIKATGNGSATYNSTAVKGKSQTFTVNEGTSATIAFTPDAGYRIKSVKLNTTDVTASVANNQYTISNIKSDNTLEVEFEAITHTLTIKATGNGGATYNSTTVKGKSQAFTVNEGESATVTFTPDAGYRIKSVKLNTTDVTASVISNQYTISDINSDNTLEVEFEAITHTLTIKATGNGSATFNSTAVKGKSQTFTVNEGISATVTFTPDAGCRIKSVKLNTADVTASVVSNQYTISNIKSDNTLEVEFEAIIHTLNIVAVGNGNVDYNGIVIRNQSQSYSVQEGSSVVLSFAPDAGYRVGSVKVNNTDVTASVANNSYTISNITANTTLSVTFEAIPPATYVFTISAVGNGTVTYDGNTVRGKTSSFTVVEGTNVIVTFSADEGYRLKSVKLDNTNVTSTVVNNQYTIRNIKANTSLEVTFEAIPTYSLNITASGNGSVTYNGTAIRGKTQTFTVKEGTSATVTFTPDAGYRIASVKLNNTDVTASVANSSYTISNITANTTLSVTFEAIPPTTYAFTISAVGNGTVTYDGNTVRGKTSSFTVVEGTNAVVTFSADEGYRLKSMKLNNTDVTSSVVNNQYTISNIKANTSLEVTFEAIPTYALNIVATGNGSASYNGVTIRNQSQSFTLREGTSAVVSFSADNGYRIGSVKLNNVDVTSQIVDGKITISSITQNTNVEVVFEEIPPTIYALSITATGNGSVTYDGKTIKGKTSTFTIIEGSYVTVQLSADDGYRLKSITLNGQDVTADVTNNQYTTPKMMADAALVVVFEAIPTFALTIKSSAFGSVKFGDAVVANRTEMFRFREGTSATMTFTPDDNGRLHSIMLNGTDITKELVNGQYTISNIRADQNVEAEFVEDITKVTDAGVAYTVTSYDEQTVVVAAGNYGNVLTVPASFTAKEKTWMVVGIDEDALKDNTALAAIVWNPEVAFTAKVSNPNLLLYVKDAQYAPATIQNVVVNNQAENIVLVEAASGNDFYCPQAFTAKRISYEHNYSMISGYKTCQGWETLVLPFDVTMMINAKGQELTPYTNWQYGNSQRPFWLYEMTTQGWKAGNGIKANTPYVISMPNNEMYDVSFNQTGNIQFIGTNVEVKASTEMTTGQYGNKRLVANYQTQEASADIYALNVSNEWSQNTATEVEGSTFIRSLRSVHPFEAYLTVEGSNAPWAIPIFENLPTGINEKLIVNSEKFATATDWYTIDGRKLQGEPKKAGIYIYKGEKVRR